MISFLKLVIYTPLYNSLIAMLAILPGADIGLAIIILTLVVKLILYPLSKKATVMQFKMKKYEGELNAIRQKYPNQQEQAVAMMEFYRKYNINPFSGFLTLLIQIPIIYSLYYIFVRSGLPTIDTSLLYSFVRVPEAVSMKFLGLFDVAGKNLWLALVAGVTSYFQMKFSNQPTQTASQTGTFNDALAKTMSFQMKVMMPALVFFISWRISGAVAIYWAVGNIITILQDYYTRRKLASL